MKYFQRVYIKPDIQEQNYRSVWENTKMLQEKASLIRLQCKQCLA